MTAEGKKEEVEPTTSPVKADVEEEIISEKEDVTEIAQDEGQENGPQDGREAVLDEEQVP